MRKSFVQSCKMDDLADQKEIYDKLTTYREQIEQLTTQFELMQQILQKQKSELQLQKQKTCDLVQFKQAYEKATIEKQQLQTYFRREVSKLQKAFQLKLENEKGARQQERKRYCETQAKHLEDSSNLKLELKTLKKQVNNLKTKLVNSQNQSQQKKLLLKQKFEVLKNQALKARQENIALNETITRMGQQLKQNDEYAAQLVQQNKRLGHKLSELEKQNGDLKHRDQEHRQLMGEASVQYKSYVREKDGQVEDLNNIIQKLTSQLGIATRGNQSLKVKLDQCKLGRDQLQSRVACLSTEIKRLCCVVEREQQQKRGLSDIMQQLRREVAALQRKNQQLGKSNQCLGSRGLQLNYERKGIREKSRREVRAISQVLKQIARLTASSRLEEGIWE